MKAHVKITILLAAATTLSCCVRESGYTVGGEEAEVDIRFRETAYTRAASADENAIRTVDVFVFDGAGAAEEEAVFLYRRHAWHVTGQTYRAMLRQGAGLNIYFAVNARSLTDSPVEGETFAQVRERLTMTAPQHIEPSEGGLPMWGMALGRTIAGDIANSIGTIRLLRSVASADIAVADQNFTLEKGYVAFGADMGYLSCSSSNLSAPDAEGNFRALVPEPPADMATTAQWSAPPTAENTVSNVFYMYDNDADGTGARKPTRIVLEGKWGGSSKTNATFYPLLFRGEDGGLLKVKRNSKYILIVTKVNGDGYATLEEAEEAGEMNVDYEVIEWERYDDGDIHIDGAFYFSVASKRVTLASQAGAVSELTFATNYAADDILLAFNEGETGAPGVADTHPRFKVETLPADADGNARSRFRITAKQDYGTEDNPAMLFVTAGRVSFTVEIEQMQSGWEYGGNHDAVLEYH